MSERGKERLDRVGQCLTGANLKALVCLLPSNVLLLSGYWPVVGTSIAIATDDGSVTLLVPEDEKELAESGWAKEIVAYSPGSLDHQLDTAWAVTEALGPLLKKLGVTDGVIGFETKPLYEGSSYSATFRAQEQLLQILEAAAPEASRRVANKEIETLRYALTPWEVSRVRLGGAILGQAFEAAAELIGPGTSEIAVAATCRSVFDQLALEHDVVRSECFAWCMSGVNSAKAGGAYARSTGRTIQESELVLLHCNPCIDGYFGDVTRTYVTGEPSEKVRSMYEAIFEARDAACNVLRPGAQCADVDEAARNVIVGQGFGEYFTHGVGHSVGFSVISPEFPPRLNPTSPDVLEEGCTINLEPSIYIPDFGGIRHCDVVTITSDGFELLTPFACSIEDLIVSG